jgi:hypothetical protein
VDCPLAPPDLAARRLARSVRWLARMSNIRGLGLAILVLAFGACGDSTMTADGGGADLSAADLSANMCGCSRPADCAGGVCCVTFDRTSGGEVVRSKCMTQLACVAYQTLSVTQTIACDKDGDCTKESADGGTGTGTCAAPTQTGFCGPKVCH